MKWWFHQLIPAKLGASFPQCSVESKAPDPTAHSKKRKAPAYHVTIVTPVNLAVCHIVRLASAHRLLPFPPQTHGLNQFREAHAIIVTQLTSTMSQPQCWRSVSEQWAEGHATSKLTFGNVMLWLFLHPNKLRNGMWPTPDSTMLGLSLRICCG